MEIWGLLTFPMHHFLTWGVWLDTKQARTIATPTTILAEKQHCLFFFNSPSLLFKKNLKTKNMSQHTISGKPLRLESVGLPQSLTLEQRSPAYPCTSETIMTLSLILYSDLVNIFALLNSFYLVRAHSQAHRHNVLLITLLVAKSVRFLTFYF